MGLGAAGVKAQVRIGGNGAPSAAAVLDLNATDATTAGTKGLALPRVSLASTTDLLGNATMLTGMLVYNTNATMTNGQGTGVYAWDGSKWLVVAGEVGTAGTVTGSNGTYRTWCFPVYSGIGCWMIDGSKEGIPSSMTYGADNLNVDGYYYNYSNALSACPAGFELPSIAQWQKLADYVNSNRGSMLESWQWFGNTSAGGYHNPVTGWRYAGIGGSWWTSGETTVYTYFGQMAVGSNVITTDDWYSVRCIEK